MALIGRVGRKRPRARLALAGLYFLVLLGSVTTLYPFLLMMSTGFKGPVDQNDNRLVPLFWSSHAELRRKYLDDKYAGDISMLQSTEIGQFATEEEVARYERFLQDLPPEMWQVGFRTATNQVTSRTDRRWQEWVRERYKTIAAADDAYLETSPNFQSVLPPAELLDRRQWSPRQLAKWSDWLRFKRELPIEFRVPVRAERIYQEFLRGKFKNQMSRVPSEIKGDAKRFEQIRYRRGAPLDQEFRATYLPAAYQDQSVEDLWAKVSDGPLPIRAYEDAHVRREASSIRSEFSWRNYYYVFDYIALNGRSLWNTMVFCLLTILVQLTVNPLAAYALSRYPIRASGKILLFLLATMAFPAEVAMIPSFLLLKDLGLLNTFAALVLPGAASGFSIFLLKGFFDSQPQEIFESAQIDGARETTMMLRIALPLSKPVLGYMALLAFMGAYGAFMYAFLVTQNRDMWTLMVFIYQLGLTAPKAVMMAAITIAAIPTLLVFLAAQRVIMRGIVLPGER